MDTKLKLVLLEERIVLDAAIAAALATATHHLNNVVVGPEVNITQIPGSQGYTQIQVDPVNPHDLALIASQGTSTFGGLTTSYNLWISTNSGSTWSEVQYAFPLSGNMSSKFDGFGDLFIANLTPDPSSGGASRPQITMFTNLFSGSPSVQNLGFVGTSDLGTGYDDYPQIAIGVGPLPGTEAIYVSDTPYIDNEAGASTEVSGAIISQGPDNATDVTAFSQPETTSISGGFLATIAVGPQGQLIDVEATNVGPPNLFSLLSATDPLGLQDNGSSAPTMQPFNAPVAVANGFITDYGLLPNPNYSTAEITALDPFIAWDANTNLNQDPHAGTIYVTYSAPDPSNPDNNWNVYVDYSTNDGASWSNPVLVSGTATSIKLNPNIAIDPTTGNVFIGWYDTRNDQGNNGPGDTDGIPNDDVEYFGSISATGGQSFLPDFQISEGATNIGYADEVNVPVFEGFSKGAFGLGDYSSPAFYDGIVYAAFEDNSSQLPNNPNQALDVAFSAISVPSMLTAVNSEYAIPLTGSRTLTVNSANGILSNIADPNTSDTIGGTLTASLVSKPLDGTVVLNKDGSFTYTPDSNFVGVDSFTYMATNGTSSSEATVYIDTQRPQINLNTPSNITYYQGGSAVLLDSNSTVTGTDLNFAGGLLNVYVENSTANDNLEIGTNKQITLSGNTVYYEGTDIGTFNGGNGYQTVLYSAMRELNIVFNSNATSKAVAAVISDIYYSNAATTELPNQATRVVDFVLSDGKGAITQTASATVKVIPQATNPVLTAATTTFNLPAPTSGTAESLQGIQISDPGLNPNSQILVTFFGNSALPSPEGNIPHLVPLLYQYPGVIWFHGDDVPVNNFDIKGTLAEVNQWLENLKITETAGMENFAFTISVYETSLNGTSFFDGSVMSSQITFNVNFASNSNPALPPPSDPFSTSNLPTVISECQLEDMSNDGSIIYVNQNATGSVHNGKSWSTAFLTLQAALAAAEADKSPEQIWVAEGTYTLGSNSSATFNLPNDIAIFGGFKGTERNLSQRNISANPTILDGEGITNDIITANGVTALLDGLTIEGASNPDGGGAAIVDNQSILVLDQMTVINNIGGGNFGASALWANGGELFIDNSLFNNNTAENNVSALTVTNAFINIIANTIFSNTLNAPNNSAVTDLLNTVSIYMNDQFIGNTQDYTAEFGGAALNAQGDGSLLIANSVFNGNSSQSDYNSSGGGAVLLISDQNVLIANSNFNNNSSDTQGGAISMLFNEAAINPSLPGSGNSQINILNSTFTNNSSEYNWGGALFAQDSSLSIISDSFGNAAGNGNNADDYSGGAAMFLSSNVLINNSVFQNESASFGGVLEIYQFNNALIENSQFIDNTGFYGSGAIDTSGSNFSIIVNHDQFINNSAPYGSGGAIGTFFESNFTVENSTFSGNSAGYGGNAIYSYNAILNIEGNTFQDTAPAPDILTYASIINNEQGIADSPSQTFNPQTVINALIDDNNGLLEDEISIYPTI